MNHPGFRDILKHHILPFLVSEDIVNFMTLPEDITGRLDDFYCRTCGTNNPNKYLSKTDSHWGYDSYSQGKMLPWLEKVCTDCHTCIGCRDEADEKELYFFFHNRQIEQVYANDSWEEIYPCQHCHKFWCKECYFNDADTIFDPDNDMLPNTRPSVCNLQSGHKFCFQCNKVTCEATFGKSPSLFLCSSCFHQWKQILDTTKYTKCSMRKHFRTGTSRNVDRTFPGDFDGDLHGEDPTMPRLCSECMEQWEDVNIV